MAGFANDYETSILNLILAAKAIANVADNAAAAPLTALWASFHSADPADTGTQGTNEINYTGYTRVSVTRTTAGWTVANGSASPVSAITFGQNTSTSTGTITHAAIGETSASTGGRIVVSGTITPNINFSQNVTPSITTGSSFTLD